MSQNILGSRMPDSVSTQLKAPADNTKTGYGQNNYKGASSDTDLSNPTRSALSVELFPNPALDKHANNDDFQKRDISAGSNVADHPQMAQNRARQSGGVDKLGSGLPANGRPSFVRK